MARLDKKSRLVLPVKVRETLGIKDRVVLTLKGDELVVTAAGDESGRAISKNVEELVGS